MYITDKGSANNKGFSSMYHCMYLHVNEDQFWRKHWNEHLTDSNRVELEY